MEVPNTRHKKTVGLLHGAMVSAQLNARTDAFKHAYRRTDVPAAVVEHHHPPGHLVLL